MTFTVRPAKLADHIAIRPLQQEIADLHYNARPDIFRPGGRFYSEDAFQKMLDDANIHIYIAETESLEVCGYVFARVIQYRNHSTYIDSDIYYIDDICVLQKYKRLGIGKALFIQCKSEAIALGCKNIDLGVHEFNKDAIAFYESCGLSPRLRRMSLNF